MVAELSGFDVTSYESESENRTWTALLQYGRMDKYNFPRKDLLIECKLFSYWNAWKNWDIFLEGGVILEIVPWCLRAFVRNGASHIIKLRAHVNANQ
jgi:hypothetical protein